MLLNCPISWHKYTARRGSRRAVRLSVDRCLRQCYRTALAGCIHTLRCFKTQADTDTVIQFNSYCGPSCLFTGDIGICLLQNGVVCPFCGMQILLFRRQCICYQCFVSLVSSVGSGSIAIVQHIHQHLFRVFPKLRRNLGQQSFAWLAFRA